MVQCETLSGGGRRLSTGDAAFVIHRVRPGVVSVVADGTDRSQFGQSVVDELTAELDRFPMGTELFIDAREVREVDIGAREVWTTWLSAHRRRLHTVQMLVRSPAMRLIAKIARHYSRTNLIIHDDPDVFGRALRRAAGRWPTPARMTGSRRAAIRTEPGAQGVAFTDGSCRYTLRAPRSGVVLVQVSGQDRGTLASAVFDQIRGHWRPGGPLQLFIDLRDAMMPAPTVSELWAAWFTANRDKLDSVRILSTQRAVSVTAAIVSWRSQTGALVQLGSDPIAFDRAFERTVEGADP